MTGPLPRDAALDALQARIGHVFSDRALLERALTHKSHGDGQRGHSHNERLEWLGDRVLGLLAAERLYADAPAAAEGELTRRFHAIVAGDTCAAAARELGMDRLVHVARGPGGQDLAGNHTVLGDAFEALMAALWLDGGRPAAAGLFAVVWELAGHPAYRHANPKNALQEWAQKRGLPAPVYRVVERDGPDHAPVFTIEAEVDGRTARASGASKQAAQTEAARMLLATGTDHD